VKKVNKYLKLKSTDKKEKEKEGKKKGIINK